MKITFVTPSRKTLWLEAAYGSICLCGIAAARFAPWIFKFAGYCPFYRLTGYPCPSCGTSRAWCAMARLDLAMALSMNPLGALLFVVSALVALYCFAVLVFKMKPVRIVFDNPAEIRLLRIVLPALILANWIWIVPVHHALWEKKHENHRKAMISNNLTSSENLNRREP